MSRLFQGKILGNVSPYSIVCTCFSQLVFEQVDMEHKDIVTEEHMKKFFSQFASDRSHSFTAKMIYKGYIDDSRNTDNAWIEAEVWNFHYSDQDKLNESIPDVKIIFFLNDLTLKLCAFFCFKGIK